MCKLAATCSTCFCYRAKCPATVVDGGIGFFVTVFLSARSVKEELILFLNDPVVFVPAAPPLHNTISHSCLIATDSPSK